MGMIMNRFSVLPVNRLPLSMGEQQREHRQNTKINQRAGDQASPHIVSAITSGTTNCLFRPLLGVTWTELVRHFLEDHPSPLLGADAGDALRALREDDYWDLPSEHRLALLEALIHAAADTEVMRK